VCDTITVTPMVSGKPSFESDTKGGGSMRIVDEQKTNTVKATPKNGAKTVHVKAHWRKPPRR